MDWTFELNGLPMSALTRQSVSIPAFSGLRAQANKREHACSVGEGPIPPGEYHIFDRQSGGLLGPLRDLFSGRSEWFALYAADGKIDDETLCNQIKRGNFRLHPKGSMGISEGCITVEHRSDFQRLRALLLQAPKIKIPGIALESYGKVIVK